MISLEKHHDPYADAIAIQRIFHAEGPHPPGTATPFCYVYSPITLPLVKLASKLPLMLDAVVYWAIFVAGTIFALWFGTRFYENERERRVFAFVVPALVFFPDLLQNDVFFAGNIAYILYAGVLLGTWIGLRKKTWLPFYVILLAVSCFKAPLLFLIVIPLLLRRDQWLPAGITVAAAAGLFLMQPHIWPELYRNYITGVELQFSFNHDFSSSPSGLTADALFDVIPYKVAWIGMWVITSCVFGSILLWLRGKYLAGKLTLQQWVPFMFCGVALLNPRIMEYDLAPLTVLIAIVLWRFWGQFSSNLKQQAIFSLLSFALANAAAARTWRPTACVTLVVIFFAGAWTLWRELKLQGTREAVAA